MIIFEQLDNIIFLLLIVVFVELKLQIVIALQFSLYLVTSL